jgi:hypothetical protein
MTIFPPLLVPTNFKFKFIFLIFNVEAEVHLESNASQLAKEPLILNPIMEKQ